jgi:hypothetical protein
MSVASLPRRPLRFLFVTLGHVESDFYGRVGQHLRSGGHDAAQLSFSRRAARRLVRRHETAWCLPDRMRELGDRIDIPREVERIVSEYDVPTFRDIYRTDFVCDGRDEQWCVERTVRHVLAMEQIFDQWRPDVVIPEVGNETLRTVARLVAIRRGIPVLFLFYTIFDNPLRVYLDTMHAPIVSPDALKPLTPDRGAEVEAFITRFTRRRTSIREPRDSRVTAHRMRMFARHLIVKGIWDRDNDYLIPFHWLVGRVRERVRAVSLRRFYSEPHPGRPFVYFPLHVTDDYKIKRVVPHCSDQAALVEQVASALPHGWDLVTKEHPMAIGRTPPSLLKRLDKVRNIHIVPPTCNSHDLIERSHAVAVISSTVGLEALLYDKPVLTLGEPYYSGFGITVDVGSFAEIHDAVPALLKFRPDHEQILRFLSAAMDRCLPGAPVMVNRSDANAETLAASIARDRASAKMDGARSPKSHHPVDLRRSPRHRDNY